VSKYPLSVSAVLLSLLLSAFIWFGFAVLVLAGAHPGLPKDTAVQWIMAALAFGSGCALIVSAWALGKRIRIAYYLVTAFLAVLAVLTVADDVGWVDLVYLVIVIAPLVLMLKDRAWYLRKDRGAEKNP
jgi:lysylphosphatidylglycerol synthetase-like protein (DUF2156 family)